MYVCMHVGLPLSEKHDVLHVIIAYCTYILKDVNFVVTLLSGKLNPKT